MPNRNLTAADNNTTICQWLNENLQGPIIPIPDNLNQVPKEKGLYFWFMRPEGYDALSNYVQIAPVEPKYEREIDGIEYHLVYLGQAGVRNNKSGTNNANVRERIKWHIKINNGPKNVCSGTMSTYRRTVGSLISDDLILNNAQDNIDSVFEKFFRVYYIKYGIDFKQVGALVLNDEHILIEILRPLFNLDDNQNAQIQGHITNQIRARRRMIEASTKTRLGCGTGTRTLLKEKKTKLAKRTIVQTSVELSDCITFKVRMDQSVHDVVNKRRDLPKGTCWILIYNSIDRNHLIYPSRNNGGWRKTGTKKSQDVYNYFRASDTNRRDIPRYKVIQQEMRKQRPPVESVTVEVCTAQRVNTNAMPIVSSQPKTSVPPDLIKSIEVIPGISDESVAKLLILPCTGTKVTGGTGNLCNYFAGYELLNAGRANSYNRLNELGANPYPRIPNLNAMLPANCLQAIDRYDGLFFGGPNSLRELMKNKIQNRNLHILIVSGLYGLLKWDDGIIEYSQKLIKEDWLVDGVSSVKVAIDQYIVINGIRNDLVFLEISPNTNYKKVIGPMEIWKNLWQVMPGRGHNNIDILYAFLNTI